MGYLDTGIWERSSVQGDGLDFRLGLCAVGPCDEIGSFHSGEQGLGAVSLVFRLLI